MNSQKSQTTDLNRIRISLIDKMDLQRCDKRVALSDLDI